MERLRGGWQRIPGKWLGVYKKGGEIRKWEFYRGNLNKLIDGNTKIFWKVINFYCNYF